MNEQSKIFHNIQKIYPNCVISEPVNKGSIHDIYIAEYPDTDKKFICRLSQKNTALHNLHVSSLLNNHDIKVPEVSVYCFDNEYDDEYYETYPFIKGKTLYERQQEGLSKEKRTNVYKQLFNISYKISQIGFDFNTKPDISLLTKLQTMFFKLFNSGDTLLYHTDLHSQNVILDENDNVSALLDLDAVYPESSAFAFMKMLKNAKQEQCDIKPLIKLCEKHCIRPRIIGIEKQLKFYNVLITMYRHTLKKSISKHLLKTHIK